MRIEIKPLSVNEVWQGRRFKTKDYTAYEFATMALVNMLKNEIEIPETGNLYVHYTFGVSNKNSDIDNLIKPFQDILQKVYNFNDKRIYEMRVSKRIVKIGHEYIDFNILPI